MRINPTSLKVATSFICVGILTLVFPHMFWFMNLWCGCVLGVAIGNFLTRRDLQTKNKSYRGTIYAFAILVCIVLIPDLYFQESMRSKIRSLTGKDVSAIFISESMTEKGHRVSIQEQEQFVALLPKAHLDYTGFDASMRTYYITIQLANGSELYFESDVPVRDPSELALNFQALLTNNEVAIPGGGIWAEESVK